MFKLTYYEGSWKPLRWLGSSRDVLRKWTKGARGLAGSELQAVQRGEQPANWKPMNAVGLGANEIRLVESGDHYRVIYVAKFAEAVYVLHVITKKKTQKTSDRDIKIAKKNYGALLQMRKEAGL